MKEMFALYFNWLLQARVLDVAWKLLQGPGPGAPGRPRRLHNGSAVYTCHTPFVVAISHNAIRQCIQGRQLIIG